MSPTVEVVRGTESQKTVVNLALLILITVLAVAVHGFHHGFRALAERGMLADRAKDRTVATLAPAIAEVWLQQTRARDNWKDFRREDFQRLRKEFGATWILIENKSAVNPAIGLDCPYKNEAVSVCSLEETRAINNRMSAAICQSPRARAAE